MPSPLGLTLFEHLVQQEQQKQMEFERRKAMEREQALQDTDRLERAFAAKQQKEQADFDRQYKMAELWGKYSGMMGDQAPVMNNPLLQEMADVSNLGGQASVAADERARAIKWAEYGIKSRKQNALETQNEWKRGFEGKKLRSEEDRFYANLLEKERHNRANEILRGQEIAAMRDRTNKLESKGIKKFSAFGRAVAADAAAAVGLRNKYPELEFDMRAQEMQNRYNEISIVLDQLNQGNISEEEAVAELVVLAPEHRKLLMMRSGLSDTAVPPPPGAEPSTSAPPPTAGTPARPPMTVQQLTEAVKKRNQGQ